VTKFYVTGLGGSPRRRGRKRDTY